MTTPADRAKLSPTHPDRWVRQGLSRAEFVYRALSARIVDGRLSPGDRLDEASIAREFEVSRTPVREALQALTAAGLAYKLRHRGVLVASMPRSRLRDMFEVMADMEALCAGYAAERMTALQRYELEKFHRDSAVLVRDGDTTAYAMFNRNFHTLIYMGSHNEVLSETARGIRKRLSPFRGAQFRLGQRLSESYAEHETIVAAIMRGDGPGARLAMTAHVRVVGEVSERFAVEDEADADDAAVSDAETTSEVFGEKA